MLNQGLPSDFYDDMYLNDDRTYDRPLTSPYYPLFSRVVAIVRQSGVRSVLEVGCGSGVLAEMLVNSGVPYTGFDFSPIAVEKAAARCAGGRFLVGDATDPQAYGTDYDGIVCCEVLEHIDGDLDAIAMWRSGTLCVCSVPNFDSDAHVRFFHSEEQIIERYGQLLDIQRIERLAKSARAGLTFGQYFQRLRWARNRPTCLLGMLGVNRFSWYSGWFIVTARRR